MAAVDGDRKVKVSKEGLRSFFYIFRYIKPYGWQFAAGLLLLVLGSLLFMIFPGAAGEMANAAAGESRFDFTVSDYGWLFLVILVFQGSFSYLRTILFAIVSERGMADVRKDLFAKMMSQHMTFFEERRVGELTSRITADVEQLQNAFSITLAEFLRQIVVLVAGVAILAFLTPALSLIMLLTFPVIVLLALVFGRYIRRVSRKRQDEIAVTNTIAEEAFQSFQVVKSFANEWFETLRYSKSVDEVVKVSLRYAQIRGIFFVFIITILFGGIFFILWRGALMVEAGEMPLGDLFAFIIYTGIIGGAIAGIGNLYTTLAGAVGASERVMEILKSSGEIENLKDNIEKDDNIEGFLSFESVDFVYPGRVNNPVLVSIDFEVKKGEKVALVGVSGSGKSTIVKLLLRFYDPVNGRILLDGRPIDGYDVRALRSHFALVPQEVILFGGTIRENIEYGKPGASIDEITEAAKLANALEFIESFPDGLETIVGDRGVKLSGGQRQRVAIARAILKDPRLLILDEATSSLDADSEKIVQEALDNLLSGRTAIIIAHRLATIKNADKILVLDGGKIVEQGRHEDLILKDGLYKRLASLQFEIDV